jgi:hypothetical protein
MLFREHRNRGIFPMGSSTRNSNNVAERTVMFSYLMHNH